MHRLTGKAKSDMLVYNDLFSRSNQEDSLMNNGHFTHSTHSDWLGTPVFRLVFILAWLTFAAGYTAVYLLTGQGDAADAGSAALQVVLPAMLLSLGVIRLCRQIPAPDRQHLWVVPVHALLALVYSLAWILIVCGVINAVSILAYGTWPGRLPPEHVMHWHFFAGTMIYLTTTGFTYGMDGIMRAEAGRRNAELQQLRAQLNPHFLFNTLHTLHALVRRDPDMAESAIEQFADLLRFQLKAYKEGADEITFAQEWQFTQDYLAIEHLRLDDRLRLETRISPETLTCRLPACLLQPLVENAIRHGIAPRADGGTLTIEAKSEDDRLILFVGDDGPGAAPEQLEDARGVGLQGIRDRLSTYYGAHAQMKIDTAVGQGFSVTLRIPAYVEEPAEMPV